MCQWVLCRLGALIPAAQSLFFRRRRRRWCCRPGQTENNIRSAFVWTAGAGTGRDAPAPNFEVLWTSVFFLAARVLVCGFRIAPGRQKADAAGLEEWPERCCRLARADRAIVLRPVCAGGRNICRRNNRDDAAALSREGLCLTRFLPPPEALVRRASGPPAGKVHGRGRSSAPSIWPSRSHERLETWFLTAAGPRQANARSRRSAVAISPPAARGRRRTIRRQPISEETIGTKILLREAKVLPLRRSAVIRRSSRDGQSARFLMAAHAVPLAVAAGPSLPPGRAAGGVRSAHERPLMAMANRHSPDLGRKRRACRRRASPTPSDRLKDDRQRSGRLSASEICSSPRQSRRSAGQDIHIEPMENELRVPLPRRRRLRRSNHHRTASPTAMISRVKINDAKNSISRNRRLGQMGASPWRCAARTSIWRVATTPTDSTRERSNPHSRPPACRT